jgi:hypothetical protein
MAGVNYLDRENGRFKRQQAITESAGSGDANKLIAANADGEVDISFLPSGFGAETITPVASENLAEGDFINPWNDSGTLKARKADNSNDRPARGVVVAGFSSSASATVFVGQKLVTGYSGLTPGGECWLGTAGRATQTPPSGDGVLSQSLGFAVSATTILAQIQDEVIL